MISSPVKESLSGSDNPRNSPYYFTDWIDEEGSHWIQYKEIHDDIVVYVTREELSKVLKFDVDAQGQLLKPSFIRQSKIAGMMQRLFKSIDPKHFAPKHTKNTIHSLKDNDGKQKSKRGGKSKIHPFLVHFGG